MNLDPLNSRLRNCLVTILELENDLGRTHLGPALQNEFTVLKKVVARLEHVNAEEQDVCRIEAATCRFLSELKDTLDKADLSRTSETRLLQ
jgi:hypothetical protein